MYITYKLCYKLDDLEEVHESMITCKDLDALEDYKLRLEDQLTNPMSGSNVDPQTIEFVSQDVRIPLAIRVAEANAALELELAAAALLAAELEASGSMDPSGSL